MRFARKYATTGSGGHFSSRRLPPHAWPCSLRKTLRIHEAGSEAVRCVCGSSVWLFAADQVVQAIRRWETDR